MPRRYLYPLEPRPLCLSADLHVLRCDPCHGRHAADAALRAGPDAVPCQWSGASASETVSTEGTAARPNTAAKLTRERAFRREIASDLIFALIPNWMNPSPNSSATERQHWSTSTAGPFTSPRQISGRLDKAAEGPPSAPPAPGHRTTPGRPDQRAIALMRRVQDLGPSRLGISSAERAVRDKCEHINRIRLNYTARPNVRLKR